ncbi:hypothetical protein Sjap_005384 [Stephania japonica]|uniref:Uncharacterized protein n=1 Tax=Stephania japonica TaxID=461633 RepID=A0AAP0PLT2_9MAGN
MTETSPVRFDRPELLLVSGGVPGVERGTVVCRFVEQHQAGQGEDRRLSGLGVRSFLYRTREIGTRDRKIGVEPGVGELIGLGRSPRRLLGEGPIGCTYWWYPNVLKYGQAKFGNELALGVFPSAVPSHEDAKPKNYIKSSAGHITCRATPEDTVV